MRFLSILRMRLLGWSILSESSSSSKSLGAAPKESTVTCMSHVKFHKPFPFLFNNLVIKILFLVFYRPFSYDFSSVLFSQLLNNINIILILFVLSETFVVILLFYLVTFLLWMLIALKTLRLAVGKCWEKSEKNGKIWEK